MPTKPEITLKLTAVNGYSWTVSCPVDEQIILSGTDWLPGLLVPDSCADNDTVQAAVYGINEGCGWSGSVPDDDTLVFFEIISEPGLVKTLLPWIEDRPAPIRSQGPTSYSTF